MSNQPGYAWLFLLTSTSNVELLTPGNEILGSSWELVRMHQNKHVKPASPSDNKPRPTELKDSMSISQEEDGSPTREANSDASVQPYRQDMFFENANIDRESRTNKNPKLQKDSSEVHKELHLQERAKSITEESHNIGAQRNSVAPANTLVLKFKTVLNVKTGKSD
ncbi:unnamed protein product [Dovyalis caffra]|uniref:Uncharacterized protein n=1 Tax=Dovyalis caffra TaxID=77055 RepID=A0AAV1SC40_9ROSI|nr:unnamed protein product [Dovyalis caffra]